ncbi:hypothetical protein KFL_000060280 [Klebsormidium nitens]|uniref:SAND domain-containing protein n=1 Tax=Klebsormidium nitens TaxID=105231 RepID=A0A0U9HQI8_KLENI|nr:hypothetical protein KFL_000060280 [Klebsormidium nitens]|eukprot:GAQ77963.1 hypothetical protein KFL_000060280 [Klebsormidium nitens]
MAVVSEIVSRQTLTDALPTSEEMLSAPSETPQLASLCQTPSHDMESKLEQLQQEKLELEAQLRSHQDTIAHLSDTIAQLRAILKKQEGALREQWGQFVAVNTPGSLQAVDREEVRTLVHEAKEREREECTERLERKRQECTAQMKEETREMCARAVTRAWEECSATKDAEISRLKEQHKIEMFNQKMAVKRECLRIVPEMAGSLNRWHLALVNKIHKMLPTDFPGEGRSLGTERFGNGSPSTGNEEGGAAPGRSSPPDEEQPSLPRLAAEGNETRTLGERAAGHMEEGSFQQAASRKAGSEVEKRKRRKKGGNVGALEGAAGGDTSQAARKAKKRPAPADEPSPPPQRPQSAPLSSRAQTRTTAVQASGSRGARSGEEKHSPSKVPKGHTVKATGSKAKKPPKKGAKTSADKRPRIETLDLEEGSPSDGRDVARDGGMRATWGTELLMSPSFVPECDSERFELVRNGGWGAQIGLEGGGELGAADGGGTGVEWRGGMEAENTERGEAASRGEQHGEENWGGDWGDLSGGEWDAAMARAEAAQARENEGAIRDGGPMHEGSKEKSVRAEARQQGSPEEKLSEENAREEVHSLGATDSSAWDGGIPQELTVLQKLKSLDSLADVEGAPEDSPGQGGSAQAHAHIPPTRIRLKRPRHTSSLGDLRGQNKEAMLSESARGGESRPEETARENEPPAQEPSEGYKPPAQKRYEPPVQESAEIDGASDAPESEPQSQGAALEEEPPGLARFDEAHRRRVRCRRSGPGKDDTYGTLAYEETGGGAGVCWVWCECAACMAGGGSARQPFTPPEFERHAGSARKNWRTSIVCCGSERTLREELGELPLQRGHMQRP